MPDKDPKSKKNNRRRFSLRDFVAPVIPNPGWTAEEKAPYDPTWLDSINDPNQLRRMQDSLMRARSDQAWRDVNYEHEYNRDVIGALGPLGVAPMLYRSFQNTFNPKASPFGSVPSNTSRRLLDVTRKLNQQQ